MRASALPALPGVSSRAGPRPPSPGDDDELDDVRSVEGDDASSGDRSPEPKKAAKKKAGKKGRRKLASAASKKRAAEAAAEADVAPLVDEVLGALRDTATPPPAVELKPLRRDAAVASNADRALAEATRLAESRPRPEGAASRPRRTASQMDAAVRDRAELFNFYFNVRPCDRFDARCLPVL